MQCNEFIDYYKILGLSPGASSEAIGQRFHRLAKQYHPDNPLTGDRDRFDMIIEAHSTLRDAERRSDYDKRHGQVAGAHRPGPFEPNPAGCVEKDIEVQNRLLHLFYGQRRHSVKHPGVPDFELERIFNRPLEQLEFHLWYLKAKHWIERLDNGMLAITVEGIDHVNAEHQRNAAIGLLMHQVQTDENSPEHWQ